MFFNAFSSHAEQVLALARKEAGRLGHGYVGTEHLLLGMIRLNQGVAVTILQRMGVDLEAARGEIEGMSDRGSPDNLDGDKIPYTPRVKRALALAGKQAKDLLHTRIGTEHLLLGLIKEGDGVAGRFLSNHRIELSLARAEILKERGQPDPSSEK